MPNLSLPKKNEPESSAPPGSIEQGIEEKLPVAPVEKVPAVEQKEESGVGASGAPEFTPPAAPARSAPTAAPEPAASVSQEELAQIEAILSEGLEDEYAAMPEVIQAAFRKEGERIATVIQKLLVHSRAAARKIADLIRKWLGMIPGVNRFFLEQEAKIKTDQLLELRRSDLRQ